LPAIQEPILGLDQAVVFSAAVDRNGYLPVHNKIYSAPQGPDAVWNNANSRNRRIFDDMTGLMAGRNTTEVLSQTYPRDLGGGKIALIKDISAPIFVRGRHWAACAWAPAFPDPQAQNPPIECSMGGFFVREKPVAFSYASWKREKML